MSGLDATGFSIPTIDEIREQINTALRDAIGQETDTSDRSVFGQLAGIMAEREYLVWLAARDVWSAFTPGGAYGQSLIQLALLTGTIRRQATKSRVLATVTLAPGAVLPAGSTARVSTDATAVFETDVEVENSGGSPDDFAVPMSAIETGPVRANAGTLTVIHGPVVGWLAVTNAFDAQAGLDIETESELRARRERELRVQGSSNSDAIAADISRVEGVLDVRVTENDTDATVGGLPPHSFRAVVWDGDPAAADDDEIAQAIWDAKPVGIASIGADSGQASDARGEPRTMAFDRADLLPVYLSFDVEAEAATWPADGEDQIEAAVVAYADQRWRVGEDVILSALYGPIFSVSGVYRVTAIRAGLAPSPVGTVDLTVAPDEIARADTSRIAVQVTLV